LLQKKPDCTKFPGGFWSRRLSSAEEIYSKTECECLGVVRSIIRLRNFLDGHGFLIKTDNQAPRYIQSTTESSGLLMRWRLQLSEFALDVLYKPRASHHAPNLLTLKENDAAVEDITDDIPFVALAETANGLLTGIYTGTDMPAPVEYDDIVDAEKNDKFCVELAKRVALKKGMALFKNEVHDLCMLALYCDQLVIPENLHERKPTLEDHPTMSAHPGMKRRSYTMWRRFYWPSVVTEIQNTIKKCTTCAKNWISLRRHTSPLKNLTVDIFGPIPAIKAGNRFILVGTDRSSKLTKCVALRRITAISLVSAIIDASVACYCPPDQILSDQKP